MTLAPGTHTAAILGSGRLTPWVNSCPSAQGSRGRTWLTGRQLTTAEVKPVAALSKKGLWDREVGSDPPASLPIR
ncbi:hypothetical protein ACFVZ3_43780, partial [Kitasatospora purpeofusca]